MSMLLYCSELGAEATVYVMQDSALTCLLVAMSVCNLCEEPTHAASFCSTLL